MGMRPGFKEFHAANPPSVHRSQHGQVCLTLHWVLISKMGTETSFGNDPADEKSRLGTRPQRLCQLQSVLAQQNFENPKLCPSSLVFQQGTQMPHESMPLSCVPLRKPQCTLAGKLKNQISKRQDTHQQHYSLTTLQLS